MNKYLPQLIEIITAPKPNLSTKLFSFSRVYNKHKTLKQCLKFWKYQNQDQLDRDIAFSYFGLLEGIKQIDEPMVLRHLSIQLFEHYKASPKSFVLEQKISDIVILDCKKVNKQQQQLQWYQIAIKIKHFNTSKHYLLQRKVFVDNFKSQPPSPRKWYFIELPFQKNQSRANQ